jgi:hypothetical protein
MLSQILIYISGQLNSRVFFVNFIFGCPTAEREKTFIFFSFTSSSSQSLVGHQMIKINSTFIATFASHTSLAILLTRLSQTTIVGNYVIFIFIGYSKNRLAFEKTFVKICIQNFFPLLVKKFSPPCKFQNCCQFFNTFTFAAVILNFITS